MGRCSLLLMALLRKKNLFIVRETLCEDQDYFERFPVKRPTIDSRSFSLRTKIVVKSATRNYVVKKLLRRLG